MENSNGFSLYGYDSPEKASLWDSVGKYYKSLTYIFKRYKPNEKNEVGYRFLAAGSAGIIGTYALGLLSVFSWLFVPLIGIGLLAIWYKSRKQKVKD